MKIVLVFMHTLACEDRFSKRWLWDDVK